MTNKKLKEAIAHGNTQIDVVVKGEAMEDLLRFIDKQLKDKKKTKPETDFLKVIRDMVKQKEINFLDIKIRFIYGEA